MTGHAENKQWKEAEAADKRKGRVAKGEQKAVPFYKWIEGLEVTVRFVLRCATLGQGTDANRAHRSTPFATTRLKDAKATSSRTPIPTTIRTCRVAGATDPYTAPSRASRVCAEMTAEAHRFALAQDR